MNDVAAALEFGLGLSKRALLYEVQVETPQLIIGAGGLSAVAETGVHFSDGSTNTLPVGGPEQVHTAWQLHVRLVGRHLRRGIYQGWDMHPAQLPTRFMATFDFFNRSLTSAVDRLERYVRAEHSGIMDQLALQHLASTGLVPESAS